MARQMQFPQQGYPPFNDLSPGSPDSLTMPGSGRRTEAGMPPTAPYSPYASLPAHGLGAGEMMHAFAGAHGQQGLVQSQEMIITKFMHDSVAPWNPLRLNAQPVCGDLSARRQPASARLSQAFPDFGLFRSAPPPSEADTVSQSVAGGLSDSGYGSMARQSVGNPSVYGGDADQSVETQSLISRFQGLTREVATSNDEPRKREARGGRRSASDNPSANGRICPDCKAEFKTNSELKKHQARHKKPYKCDVLGCIKATDGFSTNNDLDRHKRCVHKLRKADETVYRCDLGQCQDKPKDWPRQDNFRQHLKRKHNLVAADVDLSRFAFRCSTLADAVSLDTSESGASGTNDVSDSASSSRWPGLDQGHIAPARLITSNVIPFPIQTSVGEPGLRIPHGAGVPQYPEHIPGGAGLHLDIGPVFPDLSISSASPPGTSAAAVEPPSEIDHLGFITPHDLSPGYSTSKTFGLTDTPVAPKEVVQLDVEDDPEVSHEGARSERGEAEANMPDEMDVDDPSLDSASENGLHDADSEDDEPSDSATEAQDNLLRNAGAQYCNADNVASIKAPPTEVQLGADTPKPLDPGDETQASALLQSLMDKGTLDKLLKQIGYPIPEEEAETKDRKLQVNSSAASDSGHTNRCEECLKTFQRRCELKKHQKRHAKPYACTFAKCDKRFGSKNDWKRHENSQHFQHEIWRCGEKTADSPDQECGKVCHRRESLKSHLEKDHGIHDHAALDKKLADCRMGRNFELRFWCGFCQKTIEPSAKGGPAHSERFDHIDDHFNGRGGLPKADIKDWKHVDMDPIDPPGSTPGRGKRDGLPATGGPSEWVSLPRQGTSRKRVRSSSNGESRASSTKRFKDSSSSNKVVFWTCCFCGNYWRMGTTQKCMDSCSHAYCDDCRVFDDDSTIEP